MHPRDGAKVRSVQSVTSRSLICLAAALMLQPEQSKSESEPKQGPTMIRQPWQSVRQICSVGSRMAIVQSTQHAISTLMLVSGHRVWQEPGGLRYVCPVTGDRSIRLRGRARWPPQVKDAASAGEGLGAIGWRTLEGRRQGRCGAESARRHRQGWLPFTPSGSVLRIAILGGSFIVSGKMPRFRPRLRFSSCARPIVGSTQSLQAYGRRVDLGMSGHTYQAGSRALQLDVLRDEVQVFIEAPDIL